MGQQKTNGKVIIKVKRKKQTKQTKFQVGNFFEKERVSRTQAWEIAWYLRSF